MSWLIAQQLVAHGHIESILAICANVFVFSFIAMHFAPTWLPMIPPGERKRVTIVMAIMLLARAIL
jgi:hypothetical protein